MAATSKVVTVGKMQHRAGSTKAKAHQYVLKNLEAPRRDVLKNLTKQFDIEDTTASSWYHTFKRLATPASKRRSHPGRKPATKKAAKKSAK